MFFLTFLARRNLATTNGNDGHSIVSLASSDGFSGLDSRSHNLAHFTSPHVRFFTAHTTNLVIPKPHHTELSTFELWLARGKE